jgi:hypothetical protein
MDAHRCHTFETGTFGEELLVVAVAHGRYAGRWYRIRAMNHQ